MMNILENVSLADHSTMRLGGPARYYAEANSEPELVELVDWAQEKGVGCLIVGGGSNIIWRDEGWDGLVIVIRIKGLTILAEDEKSATVRIGAGEVWDNAVAWSVEKNLTGIEFLSAIPGSAGAGPVQNIGAYGAEIADTLVEVAVYDKSARAFGSIIGSNCGFGYRTSRFKTTDKGRFIITSLVLKLKKDNPQPPFYESLQNYLTRQNSEIISGGQASQAITKYTPQTIREAVMAIRKIKLPDPSTVSNNGSFFTNPIIEQSQFNVLRQKFPAIVGWPQHQKLDAPQSDYGLLRSGFGAGQAEKQQMVKVSAGWLVEQAGFKGFHDQETGMATWDANALVFVNERARSTADLLKFKQKIVGKVEQMFGITLQQEPELLP